MAAGPQASRPVGDPASPDDLVGTLAAIDVDGALRETAADAVRATRRELLRAIPLAAALGAGLLAAGGASAAEGLTRMTPRSCASISRSNISKPGSTPRPSASARSSPGR
jgi:hypothetical protein